MAYVVGEACVNCKYGDCVEVCPVTCFYEGKEMLYINPDECIDCDACIPECPVDAITTEAEADPSYTQKNADFDFSEETRRSQKDQVTNGPDYDPNK